MTMLSHRPDERCAGLQGRRILIVEDDDDSRWLLQAILRRLGLDCEVARDGREALSQVEVVHPDLILMDLMMPGLDGLEATRRLKANPATDMIPIIVLSADATPHGERAAWEAGCDAFLTKPVSLNKLMDCLAARLLE